MFEIRRTLVGVVTASAGAGALDGLVVPGRAFGCRTADDDHVLILAPSMLEAHLHDRVTKALGSAGPIETRPWTVPIR